MSCGKCFVDRDQAAESRVMRVDRAIRHGGVARQRMRAMIGGLPTVSVIIPTYNRAERVSAAVKSVMAQTPSELEIIIVDDGSTDGTEKVIRPFVEESGGRISDFRQDNRGVSAARNKGIAMARGDWIAFLDSDDVWIPEKLEWQFRAIRQSGGRCGACYANARLVYGADNKPTVFDVWRAA